MSDTIAAISSPPGAARRGILRLSGDACSQILESCLADSDWSPQAARGVFPARFMDGQGSQPVLLLWMPGPHSYTREDVAELHLPGSAPLLQAALEQLLALGARAAGPGEFTRRAFQNGRIDLTRAEGVLELVRATNEAERRSALGLLSGGLGERVSGLRAGLDGLRALCEASLDFDEADTGHVPVAELLERLQTIEKQLQQALSWESARQPPSALPRVLLFGSPNAGKSSLFNSLDDEGPGPALVSDLAGTTRDYLSRTWTLGEGSALSVRLIDTPGLDPSAQGPDASAQRLGNQEREQADLVLWVVNAVDCPIDQLRLEAGALPAGIPVLGLRTQMDRKEAPQDPEQEVGELLTVKCKTHIRISAHAEGGLQRAAKLVGHLLGSPAFGDWPLQTEAQGSGQVGSPRELFARHRGALEAALRYLEFARSELREGRELDLVAETLRMATEALDGIQGSTTPEDLLDRIFASFCIGK